MASEPTSPSSSDMKVVEAERESGAAVSLPPHRLILQMMHRGLARATVEWQLAFFLLTINLLVALILAWPLYGLLDDSLSHSLIGHRSVRVPDTNWLTGFLHSNRKFLNSLGSTIAWIGPVYMLLNTVVAAGLLEVLSTTSAFSLRRFFLGITAHGVKFLRLFALFLVVYFIIFLLLNDLAGGGLDRWTRDWSSEGGVFALVLMKNIALGFVLLLASMVSDYIKIKLVLDHSTRVLAESLRVLRFVWERRWITLGVFYGLGLVGVVLALSYAAIDAWLTPQSWWVLVPSFLVQQAFMFSRMWLRVAVYSAQMELYRHLGAVTGTPTKL